MSPEPLVVRMFLHEMSVCPQSFEKGANLIILLVSKQQQVTRQQGFDTSGLLVKPDTCVVENDIYIDIDNIYGTPVTRVGPTGEPTWRRALHVILRVVYIFF